MNPRRTKFYVDKQNAKWLGVCAGIADYTGVEAIWVRIGTVLLTVLGGFPWTIIAYLMGAWLAEKKPADLYRSEDDRRFWQGVRQSPTRSAREVRARFRDLDRRLADMEANVTSRNRTLADEIERLR